MTNENITPGTNNRPEPARPEQPRQVAPQQQGETNQADQRAAPVRRPLFRT
jgi:hypothetical protein